MPDRQSSRSSETSGRRLEARAHPLTSGLQPPDSPISLPERFFTQVVPAMQDLSELKVVLYLAYVTLRKREPGAQGTECSVTYRELRAEICRLSPELDEERLRRALDSAVRHGILLRTASVASGAVEDAYSLPADGSRPPTGNIFALYEQNIGIITPMIAEELKDADKLYPPEWIEDAFKEAVTLNKRSWRYIARILERWASEGKDSGEHQRDIRKNGADKYVKGKYGHLVKR